MSNLNNLSRDALWGVNPVLEGFVAASHGAPSIEVDVAVFEDASAAHTIDTPISGTTMNTYGVKLREPRYETNPYRVRAYVDGLPAGTPGTSVILHSYLFWGYVQSGNPVILEPKLVPLSNGMIDEVIMINYDPTYQDQPLGFGIGVVGADEQTVTSYISAQRLAAAPPRFGSQVS